MTRTAELTRPAAPALLRPPGYLLNPFGWAAEPLVALARSDATLARDILHVSRNRMHLIALALAHAGEPLTREMGAVLLRAPAGDILDAVLGRRPRGLKRAISRMPDRVLDRQAYRRLALLLDDPAAAKLLNHAGEIREAAIRAVDSVPAALRPALFNLQELSSGMDRLGEGLRWLARQGVVPSEEALIDELGALHQPDQIVARVKSLVEDLPLPDRLPAPRVGPAQRIDHPARLRSLAKRWRNCLEDFVWRVDSGDCCIYLWETPHEKAICLVERRGRLGWFLNDIKGPHNADIDRARLEAIGAAFEAAGMPPWSRISAIEALVGLAEDGRRRRRRGREDTAGEPDDDDLGAL